MARSANDEPWLAEGVREDRSTLVPRARLFGGGLVALALAVLVALGVYLAAGRKSDGSAGYTRPEDAPLIAADAGPYKVAPADPGGARITGIDDTVAGVAGGIDQPSAIAPDEPEEPLARPVAGAPATPPPADLLPATPSATMPTRPVTAAPIVAPPAAKPAAPPAQVAQPSADPLAPPAKPRPSRADADQAAAPPSKPTRTGVDPLAPAAKPDPARAAHFDPAATATDGATTKAIPAAAKGNIALQLGAFSTRDKADAAWAKAGSGGALAGLTKRVEPIERDGATLYRLRAAGVASKAAAAALCGRIAATGGACIVAG